MNQVPLGLALYVVARDDPEAARDWTRLLVAVLVAKFVLVAVLVGVGRLMPALGVGNEAGQAAQVAVPSTVAKAGTTPGGSATRQVGNAGQSAGNHPPPVPSGAPEASPAIRQGGSRSQSVPPTASPVAARTAGGPGTAVAVAEPLPVYEFCRILSDDLYDLGLNTSEVQEWVPLGTCKFEVLARSDEGSSIYGITQNGYLDPANGGGVGVYNHLLTRRGQ